MVLKRHFFSVSAIKSSKVTWLLAIFFACLLPFVIIKIFSGEKNNNLTAEASTPSEFEVIQLIAPALPVKKIAEPELTKSVPETKPAISPAVAVAIKPVNKPLPVVKSLSKETEWQSVIARPGDSMATIFKRVGLSMKTLQVLLQNKPYKKVLTRIKPGLPVQFMIKNHVLEQMRFQVDKKHALDIARNQNNYRFNLRLQTIPSLSTLKALVNSTPISINAPKKHVPKVEFREIYLSATVQYSLYSTAKRQQIPYKLIQQMIDILHWEINFSRDVRGGDRFSIMYKAKYIDNKFDSAGEILAVTYTSRGVAHKALRHVSSAGEVDYFTPEGKSLRQAFSRYPIKFSRINSPFSLSRMHPVLHYNRPHRGIDLAAPTGTPIRATGDGRIEVLGYESGYGNVIKIVHHNKLYTSVYAHLLKFQKGIFRGGFVKRGQVIGYVGQSGLATGPHCHYEFHVNHHPKNPSTVPLPRAMPVPSRDLAAFKHHADKMIEHLKLLEEAQAHSTSKKYHAVG